MHETLLNKYGVKQLGYYVESIEKTAELMAKMLGAGPFFDMGVTEPSKLEYRGKESGSRTRCALGHLNNIQIELIEVVNDEPNVYEEIGRFGLHHLCIWADDAEKVANEFIRAGFEVAMEMVSGQGLHIVYIDAREELGSFIEVNAPLEQLYQGIKMQHENWDGTRPLRPVTELMGR